jgi:hypothetical protein
MPPQLWSDVEESIRDTFALPVVELAKVVEGFREQQQDGTVTVPDAFYDRYVTSLETLLKLKSESADHAVIEKFLCQVLAAEREAFDIDVIDRAAEAAKGATESL